MGIEIEMISVPKVLMNRLKKYIEVTELLTEWSNGHGKSLDYLVRFGEMPIEYYEIAKLLDNNDNKGEFI